MIKKIGFIIFLCIAILFVNSLNPFKSPLSYFEKEEEIIKKVILVEEELSLQGEVIVNKGIMVYEKNIVSDSVLPFDRSELDVRITYQFIITYKLENITVIKVGPECFVTLPDQFYKLQPIQVDEKFMEDREVFGVKFDKSDFETILYLGREDTIQKIAMLDTKPYRAAVEENIELLLQKFGVTKINYDWK